MAESTYYDILGVPEKAGPDEIKAAYRRLARKLPMDADPMHLSLEQAQDVIEINAAYAVLTDAARRASYDRLRAQKPAPAPATTAAPPARTVAAPASKGRAAAPARPRAEGQFPNSALIIAPIVIVGLILALFAVIQNQTPAQAPAGGRTAQNLDPKQVATLEQKLQANPKDTAALLELGNLYLFNAGQPAVALPYYNRILDIDPNHLDAILESGQAHQELGNAAAAEERFKKAQGLAPLDAHVQYHWGLFYQTRQPAETEKAIAAFKQAIALAPGSDIAKDSQQRIDTLK